jgi:spermidine synthase
MAPDRSRSPRGSRGDPRPLSISLSRPRIGEDDGRRALLVDGVVQSIAVESGQQVGGYWAALLPSVRPRRALVLGLGGGTVVHLLHRRFGPTAMIGVEVDEEVLALARAELGLQVAGLEVVRQDAFAYVADCRERFDFICVDLFRGTRFERAILGRPFLRRLKALATPGAEIVLNLFQDRRTAAYVQRIGRVLAVRSTEHVGNNVVVRAGIRGPGRSER